jgi:hypothetical protein
VRNKLAQLVNVRRHKMEEGLRQISGTATVRVNGLGAYELNLIRNNFQGALDMFLKLEAVRCSFASAVGLLEAWQMLAVGCIAGGVTAGACVCATGLIRGSALQPVRLAWGFQ